MMWIEVRSEEYKKVALFLKSLDHRKRQVVNYLQGTLDLVAFCSI